MQEHQNLNEELLKQIDENTHGIIWFTKETISTVTNLHSTFNYLVDGKISKFIDYSKDSNIDLTANNFFITKNFNTPVIIMNSYIQTKFTKNDLEDFKMIIEKFDKKQETKLLVIGPTEFKIPEIIQKSGFKISYFTH